MHKPHVILKTKIFDPKNHNIRYIKLRIEKENRKTMKFFEEISKNNDYSFSKIAGPHGYTHILFGNCIVPGIIESESNKMKIAKRNRYYLGQKSLENIEKMPTYNGEYDNHYKFYAAAFSLYEENSRLLHDIINSITFFLDIKIKDSLCLSPEISNGMSTLNDLILEIKNIKSQYLSKFSYSENYEEILNKLDGSISNFKDSVKYYYQETDQFNNETSLSKEEDDLVSGYSLFNTLIDYHTGLSKGPRNIRSNLKPHKMLRKFQRMFVNHAEKRKVKIMFTKNSYYSSNVIKNYSDIYIAFFSIIENAIKYSIYGETINFDLVDYDKETHVKISNRCESLNVTDINRLTEKGFRGENSKGSIQSSGLGLHLVKEIFEKGEVDFNIKCDEGIFEIIVMLKDLEN